MKEDLPSLLLEFVLEETDFLAPLIDIATAIADALWLRLPWFVVGAGALFCAFAVLLVIRWRNRCRRLQQPAPGVTWRIGFAAATLLVPLIVIADLYLTGIEREPTQLLTGLFYIELGVLLCGRRLWRNRTLATADPHAACVAYAADHRGVPFTALFYPIPFLPYQLWLSLYMRRLRRSPRQSDAGVGLRRVTGRAADPYLNEGQRLEKTLKAVEYDVWVAPDGTAGRIECYPRLGPGYHCCARCGYRTASLRRRDELARPTGAEPGRERKLYICRLCGHWTEVYQDVPSTNGWIRLALGLGYDDDDER